MSETVSIPADLRALADKTAAEITQRIKKVEWQGRTVWVKKPVPPKSNIWTGPLRLLALVTTMGILRPTPNPGGVEGLRLEAWRIGEFRRAGFTAPEVLGLSDNWLLLGDLGEMADKKLQKDKTLTPKEIADIICDCAEGIAKLHKAGLAHGRAKLNDLALLQDGNIGFIDFEEDIDAGGMPLPALQARDLWLFLCSAARYETQYPHIVEEAYASYLDVNSDKHVAKELKKFLKVLSPLRYIVWPLHKSLGNDFKWAFDATSALLRYKPLT